MVKLLAKIGRSDITVHGFGSTFRDWAHEMTDYPKYVIEMALAHVIGDKVEAAYRRGDLFEKRRRLMAEWARYCSAPAVDSCTTQAGQAMTKRRRQKSSTNLKHCEADRLWMSSAGQNRGTSELPWHENDPAWASLGCERKLNGSGYRRRLSCQKVSRKTTRCIRQRPAR